MNGGDDTDWTGLDPADWDELRALGHRMMDDMVDHLAGVRGRRVWTPMPADARAAFRTGLPHDPAGADAAYQAFKDDVLPYELGNTNPRFMGWVHGGGNPVGMLAELLAGGLNANLGGRDQAPVEVERQVIRWSAEMLGFPAEASGQLVTGTSMANLMAVLVARTDRLGPQVRSKGICGVKLRAYTSRDAHSCVPRAMDMAGFGSEALRLVGTDADHRMDIGALRVRIATDRAAGETPFLVIGTAGSSGRIPWRSIFINGRRCPTIPGVCWCAMARGRWRRLRRTRPICGGKPAAWRAERRGCAISVRICRAGSGR
jgi:hypothetical protein